LLKGEMEPIRTMVNRAKWFVEQSELAGIFDNGKPEVTVEWDDNGLPCKARPDLLSDDFHLSVKTTNHIGGAHPAYFSRHTLGSNGYDFAQMFYRRGLEKNDIYVEHRILVIEQQKPHGCCIVKLSAGKEAIAGADVERAIATWRECESSGHYPGYSYDTFEAEATPWELAAAEEREYNALMVMDAATVMEEATV
jgi:hypothetical protein